MDRSEMISAEPAVSRRGPRGSRGTVRAKILEAARATFATSGWKATTQEVAGAAGVDPRTVAYYFADRTALLDAALESPPGWLDGVERINDVPLSRRGGALVRALLTGWSSPELRQRLQLIIAIGTQYAPGLAALDNEYRVRFLGAIERGLLGADAHLRASLIASELAMLSVRRFVWRLEPIAAMSDDAVVALVGPTVQRYLDGDLGLPAGQDGQLAG